MASALPDDLAPAHAVLTEDDARAWVRDRLTRLGCTFAELERMWRTSDYATTEHRVAWVQIGGFGHFAEG